VGPIKRVSWMEMEPYVSVVVPTFNRRAGVCRLLLALGRQTYPATRFEVVVVDDGSTDGTPEAIRRLDVPYALTFRRQPVNGGPAVARNAGVAQARGPLILFLDDDVVPPPDLIAVHVESQLAAPGSAVIGPMLPPPDARRPAWVRWEETALLVQYEDMRVGRFACGPRQFYTGNASLPRDRFLAAGGFDQRFKRAEDVELAYRLRNAGLQFIFQPRAPVLHYAQRSFASWSQAASLYGRYDVVMHRDQGHEALACAFVEFHRRNRLTRWLVRLCLGRPLLSRGALAVLGGAAVAADRLRLGRLAGQALSGVFNLRYWQGVSDELGGPGRVWPELARGASGTYPQVGPVGQGGAPVTPAPGAA
jgi:glycosyltransferase involved in cell wall biosynthesis